MRYSYYSICSKIIISNITVYCNVLFINSSSFLHSSDLLKFSANSFITSRCLFFLLRLSPLLIPPFLPISRSSLGLRSVFGIKFESFTIQPPLPLRSGFAHGSRHRKPFYTSLSQARQTCYSVSMIFSTLTPNPRATIPAALGVTFF